MAIEETVPGPGGKQVLPEQLRRMTPAERIKAINALLPHLITPASVSEVMTYNEESDEPPVSTRLMLRLARNILYAAPDTALVSQVAEDKDSVFGWLHDAADYANEAIKTLDRRIEAYMRKQ